MRKILLEIPDDKAQAGTVLCEEDDNFDIVDSILWQLDYGEPDQVSEHRTKYGDIKIKEVQDEQD